jgi:hypothetical protein
MGDVDYRGLIFRAVVHATHAFGRTGGIVGRLWGIVPREIESLSHRVIEEVLGSQFAVLRKTKERGGWGITK